MPKFSVIIPLYNGAKYIRTALDSVCTQTFKDFEIVICDDGSTDDSAVIVKEYSGSHPELKIKYVYQKNKGLGGARNTAMRNAEGEIFALLDQDDIWHCDKLEKVKMAFDEHKDISVVCHNEEYLQNGAVVSISSYGPSSRDMFRQLLFKGNCLSTSATSFKKIIFERLGGFSQDVGLLHFVEDYDYWLRIANGGFQFYFMKARLGWYVLHSENYSVRNAEIMYSHEINVIDINYKRRQIKKRFDLLFLFARKSMLCLYCMKVSIIKKQYLAAVRCLFILLRSMLSLA